MSMFNMLLIIAGVLEYILLGVDFKVRLAPPCFRRCSVLTPSYA